MSAKKAMIGVIVFILLFSTACALEEDYSNEELNDMSAQLARVFDFVGLENPEIAVENKQVIVDLDLPHAYTEEGTLAYIIINAAEIAPHTETIVVRITSGSDGSVQASAKTTDVLDYVEGKLSEQEFNDKIEISQVQSTINTIFALIALIVIIIVIRKIYQYAKINQEKVHIHRHHSVHPYLKKSKKKKSSVKKKPVKSKVSPKKKKKTSKKKRR